MNFSIPADFKTQTIHNICNLHQQYKHRVIEVYGQLTSCDMIYSAKEIPSLPAVDEKQLQAYIKMCHANGILFNYTLNASCLGNLEFRYDGIRMLKNLSNGWLSTPILHGIFKNYIIFAARSEQVLKLS